MQFVPKLARDNILGTSDHQSFADKNIKVKFYHTGLHSDYHKRSDTPEKLNYQGMEAIAKQAFLHIMSLVGRLNVSQKVRIKERENVWYFPEKFDCCSECWASNADSSDVSIRALRRFPISNF